jgi:hypothetical protein
LSPSEILPLPTVVEVDPEKMTERNYDIEFRVQAVGETDVKADPVDAPRGCSSRAIFDVRKTSRGSVIHPAPEPSLLPLAQTEGNSSTTEPDTESTSQQGARST